ATVLLDELVERDAAVAEVLVLRLSTTLLILLARLRGGPFQLGSLELVPEDRVQDLVEEPLQKRLHAAAKVDALHGVAEALAAQAAVGRLEAQLHGGDVEGGAEDVDQEAGELLVEVGFLEGDPAE